jgi:TRAP-type C4-dicarboxylate transport system permease small subunit
VRGIEVFSTWAAGLCLGVNIAVVLFGVVMRYGFAASPIWADELARYALIWAVMLAGAALRRGEHMQIDIVLQTLPRVVGRIADAIRRLANLGVLAFMAIMGAYSAQKLWGMTTLALNVPRTIPTASVPAGMGLMLVQYALMQVAGPALRAEDANRVPV